jgi:hypothetical protein
MRRLKLMVGVLGLAAASAAIAAGGTSSRTDRAPAAAPPAAAEMHAFEQPASATVPEPAAEGLADLPGVRTDRERVLVPYLEPGRFGVFAAPTTSGGVCLSTPVGGGCVDRFDDTGVALNIGMNTDVPAKPDSPAALAARELLAGVAADRVSALWVVAGDRRLPVVLHDGGFVYEAPAPGVWADELVARLDDGSVQSIRIGNPNRP